MQLPFLIGTSIIEYLNHRDWLDVKEIVKKSILSGGFLWHCCFWLVSCQFIVADSMEDRETDVVFNSTSGPFTWIRELSSDEWSTDRIAVEQSHQYRDVGVKDSISILGDYLMFVFYNT